MPVSHIGLTVSHLPTSCSFFLAALQPLGYSFVGQFGNQIGLGVTEADFFLTQETPGMKAGAAHVAFSAPSRAAVRNFYANALRAGGTPHGLPATREDGLDMFNAAVFDCDGNSVEVVFHEDAALDDGASSVGQSRVLALHQNLGDNKSTVSTKSTATAVRAALAPAGSVVSRKAPSVASSVASKSSSKTIEMPAVIKRNFTAPILTPKSSDDTISISRKTLVGTILGAAAGAAVAYAMCKSEEDSAKKERSFLAQLQSQQAAQQTSRPKLIEQASDPQPVYSSSPRSIQNASEAELYFKEHMQPRQIEPAPASHHHPSYTTVFTIQQKPVERMSTAARSRLSLGRTVSMPEEQRSQAPSRAQRCSVSNFELDQQSQAAPSRVAQSTLTATSVPEPSKHRSSASHAPSERSQAPPERSHALSERRSSHSSPKFKAAKSHVPKALSEFNTTSSSKHSNSSGKKHRSKSRRGSEISESRSPSPVLGEVPELRRLTPSSRSSVLGRSVIDYQSDSPYSSSSGLDTGNDTDTVVPSDSISCVGSSRRSHRPSSQLSQRHSVHSSPQQQPPLQFSARTPSHSSKRDDSRRTSEAASLPPPSSPTVLHISHSKSKRASSNVSGGSKHSSKPRSSHKERKDSKDVMVLRSNLIEEVGSDEEEEASTVTPGKYSKYVNTAGQAMGLGRSGSEAHTLPIRGITQSMIDRHSGGRKGVASYAG